MTTSVTARLKKSDGQTNVNKTFSDCILKLQEQNIIWKLDAILNRSWSHNFKNHGIRAIKYQIISENKKNVWYEYLFF